MLLSAANCQAQFLPTPAQEAKPGVRWLWMGSAVEKENKEVGIETDMATGTGKEPSAGQPVTFTSEPDFEDYGTGCLLLGAAEYYKLQNAPAATKKITNQKKTRK